MKNYWLNRKKCERKWKRIEIRSTSCHTFVLDDDWDCEKDEEKLEKWEAEFDFTTSRE